MMPLKVWLVLNRLLLLSTPGLTPTGFGDDGGDPGCCPHPGCQLPATHEFDEFSGWCPLHLWFLQSRCPYARCGQFAMRGEPGVAWSCDGQHEFDGVLCPTCRWMSLPVDDQVYRCTSPQEHAFTVRVGGCASCDRFGNMSFDDQRSAWVCEACRRVG